MPVRALTTSLLATLSGAAAAMTCNASLYSSAPRSTASAAVSLVTSSPFSTDCSQRLTFWTISACVSPSKVRLAMQSRYSGPANRLEDEDQQDDDEDECAKPDVHGDSLVGDSVVTQRVPRTPGYDTHAPIADVSTSAASHCTK